MTRSVRLVIVDRRRAVLGELPVFEVESPWWPDVEPVVTTAAASFGIDVHVLRLVDVVGGDETGPRHGLVTYEAEVMGGAVDGLVTTNADVGGDDPRRARWARPGGVGELVAWAEQFVELAGLAQQVKTWNLSCLVRVPTKEGIVWAKVAPPFFAHEGAVMAEVSSRHPDLLPPVLAAEPGRVLLGDVPGDDGWEAPPTVVERMIAGLRQIQSDAPTPDELVAMGLPDWRSPALLAAVTEMVERDDVRRTLDAEERAAVDEVVNGLGARLDALDRCGIEPTLVHGDFHRGNWRGDGGHLVLLDWGDSGVGHPFLDLAAFLNAMPADWRPSMRARWLSAWPPVEAETAATLIEPVAALRQALIYRTFLDQIERSEQRYHEADVPFWLRAAVRTAGL